MKSFFITGTDTHVGKTLTSAILTSALSANYWKPIQSGIQEDIPDQEYVATLTQLPVEHFFPSTYSFKASLSPDQAARLENVTIDMSQCILPRCSRHLIVEGAGGVFVPINDHESMLHLMQRLNMPIVIVSRGTLGTINHTLLTINALRQQGLSIHGIVFSGKLNPDNQATIEKWGNVRTLFHIPHFNEVTPENVQHWVRQHKTTIVEKFI